VCKTPWGYQLGEVTSTSISPHSIENTKFLRQIRREKGTKEKEGDKKGKQQEAKDVETKR
jgi:hypothetical protein